MVRTAEELGKALGLSFAETAEMKFRSDLTVSLAKLIQSGRLTHDQIAKVVDAYRTRVSSDFPSFPPRVRLDRREMAEITWKHPVLGVKFFDTEPLGEKRGSQNGMGGL